MTAGVAARLLTTNWQTRIWYRWKGQQRRPVAPRLPGEPAGRAASAPSQPRRLCAAARFWRSVKHTGADIMSGNGAIPGQAVPRGRIIKFKVRRVPEWGCQGYCLDGLLVCCWQPTATPPLFWVSYRIKHLENPHSVRPAWTHGPSLGGSRWLSQWR